MLLAAQGAIIEGTDIDDAAGFVTCHGNPNWGGPEAVRLMPVINWALTLGYRRCQTRRLIFCE